MGESKYARARLFGPGVTVAVPFDGKIVALPRCGERSEVDPLPGFCATDDGVQMQLGTEPSRLDAVTAPALLQGLLRVEGVLPAGMGDVRAGAVDVPVVPPDTAGIGSCAWEVVPGLRVRIRGMQAPEDGIAGELIWRFVAGWDTDGELPAAFALTLAETWRLARVLASVVRLLAQLGQTATRTARAATQELLAALAPERVDPSDARMFAPGATRDVRVHCGEIALPAELWVEDSGGWGAAGGVGEGEEVRLFDYEEPDLSTESVASLLGELVRIRGVAEGEWIDGCVSIPLVEPDEVDHLVARWAGPRISIVHRGRSDVYFEFEPDAIVEVDRAACIVLSVEDVQLLVSHLNSVLAWQEQLGREFGEAASTARLRIVTAFAAAAEQPA